MKELSEQISATALRAHDIGRRMVRSRPENVEELASELHACAEDLHTQARLAVSAVSKGQG